MRKVFLMFAATLEFVLSMIGLVVVVAVICHAAGTRQLVICYGKAPTCDKFIEQEPKP